MSIRENAMDAMRLARMAGTSVAGPGAALWATDFLNAAYFRRRPAERDIDDLRLAFTILATRWHRIGRRLGARDLLAFHRAFGRARFRRPERGFGTLTRPQLEAGADRLLGGWFTASDDAGLRGWGVAFPSEAERRRFRPEARLRRGRLRPLAPPREPPERQCWSVYRPVPVADIEVTVSRLLAPETWPDHGSELGRFTPIRAGGALGQTFEIEIIGHPTPRSPLLTRGYVTVTRAVIRAEGRELDTLVAELEDGIAAAGGQRAAPLPAGAEALLALELTTHAGHFMGRARSRLLVYRATEGHFLRAVGSWDPMGWPVGPAYRRAGETAQHAFWGEGAPEQSMLHQLAASRPS